MITSYNMRKISHPEDSGLEMTLFLRVIEAVSKGY